MLWGFPALSLLLLAPPPSPPCLSHSPFFESQVWGQRAASHLSLDCSLFRFWAEHWIRLRGAHRADLLLLRRSRWSGVWFCRPSACCHVYHGGDSGGVTMCWPLEEVPWYWNGDDHHQSRQVSMFLWVTKPKGTTEVGPVIPTPTYLWKNQRSSSVLKFLFCT